MSFWVISTFNISEFYEQGVNQDPAPTASCKGLINRRFMGQRWKKAGGVEKETRLGSQGAGVGSRIFPPLQGVPEYPGSGPRSLGLGVMVGWPGWAWALVCVFSHLGLDQGVPRSRGQNCAGCLG